MSLSKLYGLAWLVTEERPTLQSPLSFHNKISCTLRAARAEIAGRGSGSGLEMVSERKDEKTEMFTMWREMELRSKKQEVTKRKQSITE